MSAVGSPFAPFAPTSPTADPLAGAQFGFQIPEGDPGEMRTAAGQASAIGLALTGRAQDVRGAAATASDGWSGRAEGSFAALAGRTVSVFGANADAFTRAGTALSQLADALEHAQQVTEQALTECTTYQGEQTTQQTAAQTHSTAAQGYTNAAAAAAHPAAAHALTTQATEARTQADTATRAARTAGDQLADWSRRGRNADAAYRQEAARLAGEISAASDALRPLPTPAGGAAPPVPVSAHDISVAETVWPLVKSTSAADLRGNPGRAIDQAAGRHLTPGQMAALYGIAGQARHDDQKGSIWDGVGGWVSGETGGAISFGNPDTARYRGGEAASWIPLSPESVEEDGERGLAKVGGDETAHVAKDDDPFRTPGGVRYGPANPGPLDEEVAGTFRSASYTETVAEHPTTVYRAYGGSAQATGGYWSRTPPAGPLQTTLDSALDPAWGNTMEHTATASLPEGTRYYEGAAAPQPLPGGGSLPGGGNQIYIAHFDPRWITK